MAEQDSGDSQKLRDLLSGVDPEDLRNVMPPIGGVITMMFTDIVDSTRVKKQIGDDPYFEALKIHHSVVRECLQTFHGHEIKNIGDSFFATFSQPREAITCAIEIQRRLIETPIAIDKESMRVRIGIHTGTPRPFLDAVSKHLDHSGTDVDKAARVESLARGGQVLISEETNVLAKPQSVCDWGRWEMKGLEPQRVFEVLWPGKSPEKPAGHTPPEQDRFGTSFVGRKKEVGDLVELMNKERLVTIHGLGGIGKTRLADAAAREMKDRFPDGAAFVELAAVHDSEQALVSELIVQFDVRVQGFKTEADALISALRARGEALLILDNCEAVMKAAPFLAKLHRHCPALHLLVTSQRPTWVEAEQLYLLGPMKFPEKVPAAPDTLREMDAFSLFQERAVHASHGWQLTHDNFAIVAEILKMTEGIPLAIKLAAAPLRTLRLVQIRDGLKRSRLQFAMPTGVSNEPRHDSMRSCLEWSFGLLKEEAKKLFPALSVFNGGFYTEDAQAVCQFPNASHLVESMHEASLLESAELMGLVRYRMLEVVRAFAANKLKISRKKRLKARHAAHFLNVLREAVKQLSTNEQGEGFARIDADYENILAGIETSRESGDHRTLVRYSIKLEEYLFHRGRFTECLSLARQAVHAAQQLNDRILIATTQTNLGVAYQNLSIGDREGNLRQAISAYEEALRVRTEREFPSDWALTQNNLGIAFANLQTGDSAENFRNAIVCFEAALRVRTEQDLPREWANTQHNLGTAFWNTGTGDRAENLRRAITCFELAKRVRTESDFPHDWAMTQNNLGVAYLRLPTGDPSENLERATRCFDSALRVRTLQDFPLEWAMTQGNLGNFYRELPTGDREHNLRRAVEYHKEALRIYTEHDHPREWANTNNNLANAYSDLAASGRGDDLRCAIDYYEAAARGYRNVGMADEAKTTEELALALKAIDQLGDASSS